MDAQHHDLFRFDYEGNGDPSFESDDAKAATNVVTSATPFGREFQPTAIGFESVQIAVRDPGSCALRYPVIQLRQIGFGVS